MLNGREKLNYFKLCLTEQLYICVCVLCKLCNHLLILYCLLDLNCFLPARSICFKSRLKKGRIFGKEFHSQSRKTWRITQVCLINGIFPRRVSNFTFVLMWWRSWRKGAFIKVPSRSTKESWEKIQCVLRLLSECCKGA